MGSGRSDPKPSSGVGGESTGFEREKKRERKTRKIDKARPITSGLET